MKMIESIQTALDSRVEKIQDYLDSLSTRERYMVIFTTIFVIVSAVGSALFYTHQWANEQQKRLNAMKDTVVWMQGHAATMRPAGETQLDASEKLQRTAQQLGLSVSSQQIDGKIALSLSHPNYSVVANFLTQLAQSGLSVEKMEINQADGQINLTANVL